MIMFEFTCKGCGNLVHSDAAFAADPGLCAACNTATSIAIAEHATQQKFVTAPADGAFREGDPPLPEPRPPVAREAMSALTRSFLAILVGSVVLPCALYYFLVQIIVLLGW